MPTRIRLPSASESGRRSYALVIGVHARWSTSASGCHGLMHSQTPIVIHPVPLWRCLSPYSPAYFQAPHYSLFFIRTLSLTSIFGLHLRRFISHTYISLALSCMLVQFRNQHRHGLFLLYLCRVLARSSTTIDLGLHPRDHLRSCSAYFAGQPRPYLFDLYHIALLEGCCVCVLITHGSRCYSGLRC